MIKLNGREIKPTIFPDGTSQVWKTGISGFTSTFNIEWNFENEAEFIHLVQLVQLIRSIRQSEFVDIKLYMPYLPYARQDKYISDESTFALHVFMRLLNSLNLKEVKVFDPHSDYCSEIKNIEIVEPTKEIYMTIGATEPDFIIYPDYGAMRRYKEIIDYNYNYVKKERNQLTGEITKIEYDFDVKDKTVLIVDDICDGGKTFITLAQDLFLKNVKEVNLYVSHGIFSRGIEVLKDAGINRIFTKDGEVK